MASSRFSVCQVCDIIAGDDGESEYMFPGSDDELEMGETGERVNYFDREVQGDSVEMIDYLDRAQMDTSDEDTDKGESNEESSEEEEEDSDGGRTSTCHGVLAAPMEYYGQTEAAAAAGGAPKFEGGEEVVGGVAGEPPWGRGQLRLTGSGQAWGGQWTCRHLSERLAPLLQCPRIRRASFLLFSPPSLLDRVIAETNRFASTCLSASQQEGGSPSAWATTADEMKAFLGFLVLMGIQKLPGLYDYWSTDEVLHSFAIASRISRKRFLDLRRFLHFVDNDTVAARGEDGYDRLAKVRPVITAVKDSFLASYTLHCQCAIDEAMVRFKGRSSLKQYLPMKPTKTSPSVWGR